MVAPLRRIVSFQPYYDEKGRLVFSYSQFVLECGHTVEASPPCCKYNGCHTVKAYAFLTLENMGKDWKEINMRKRCHDCDRGKPVSPKCPKTEKPLGVMTFGFCHDNCNEVERQKCFRAYIEWDEQMKQ